jgi:hypothetical protein
MNYSFPSPSYNATDLVDNTESVRGTRARAEDEEMSIQSIQQKLALGSVLDTKRTQNDIPYYLVYLYLGDLNGVL